MQIIKTTVEFYFILFFWTARILQEFYDIKLFKLMLSCKKI